MAIVRNNLLQKEYMLCQGYKLSICLSHSEPFSQVWQIAIFDRGGKVT